MTVQLDVFYQIAELIDEQQESALSWTTIMTRGSRLLVEYVPSYIFLFVIFGIPGILCSTGGADGGADKTSDSVRPALRI
jgi:hypothetical protein